jgi:histidine triad (HIT) family protein
MSDPNCIFCKIAAHDVPSDIVHESDTVVAFRDTDPKAPTHILLIPREHVASVADLGSEHGAMLAELAETAAELARSEGIDESGWRLVTNVGAGAGQSVFHLHFHLLGGRPMTWPPG